MRLCLVALFWLTSFGTAMAQAPLFIKVSTDRTGGIVGPLNTVGDDFCPSSSASGCDFSASDAIVRTHDGLTYDFGVRVDAPGDEVFIRATLDPGLVWTDLPGSCDNFSSSISGDGTSLSPSEFVCELGTQSAWAANLTATARVLGTVPNNTTLGINSAEIGGAASPSVAANTGADSDVIITASPRLDARLYYNFFSQTTHLGVSGVALDFTVYFTLWDNDRNGNPSDDPDALLGNELIGQNLTVTPDFTAVSPNAYLQACFISSGGSVLPLNRFDPSRPRQSVLDVGGVSCPITGPG